MANGYARYNGLAGAAGGGGGGSVNSVTASSPLSSTGGTNPNISISQATTSTGGFLSSTDWNTFNNKQNALTIGNFTDAGTDGIIVTNGTGAVIGTGTSLAQHVADTTHNGYLSSVDWNTFNGKQSAGSYITALTGDVTASGPGSVAATIANNAVTNAKLAQIPAHSYIGNNTGSTANAADITSTQLTADLNLFTTSLQGLVPASGGGTTNFLRADGTFAAPSGTGANTALSNLTTTSINQDLLPGTDGAQKLGNFSSLRWGSLYALSEIALINSGNVAVSIYDTTSALRLFSLSGFFTSSFSMPSGASVKAALRAQMSGDNSYNLGIFTESNGVASANASGSVDIETGNKSAGTGDSGTISIQTGTSAGGARGSIKVNALGIVASGAAYVGSSNQLNSVVLTNGQLLVGSTGANPVGAAITAGAGISITNGAGSITVSATGSLEFYASAAATTSSSNITATSFTTFSNSPTLTFSPVLGGTYKVYCSLPLDNTASANTCTARVAVTSGSPTLLTESQGTVFASAVVISNNLIQSTYTLTASTSYSFDIQAKVATAGSINNRGDLAQFYIYAERMGA